MKYIYIWFFSCYQLVVSSDLKLPVNLLDVIGYYEFTGNYWLIRDFHWNLLPTSLCVCVVVGLIVMIFGVHLIFYITVLSSVCLEILRPILIIKGFVLFKCEVTHSPMKSLILINYVSDYVTRQTEHIFNHNQNYMWYSNIVSSLIVDCHDLLLI